jgi:hypothetical protein
LTTFSDRIAPETPTGCAAPTFVPGAMAATGQESRMNVPAEAAREPEGATKQSTGTLDPVIDWTISLIDESNPPGVSISSRIASTPASFADAIPATT